MGTWNSRRAGAQDETLEAMADVEIKAARQAVWDLIKPAEHASMFEPQITRAFRAEGTPSGVGEVQIFIYKVNGREQISALEVIDEVSGEYAITRSISNEEFPPLVGFFLSDTAVGTRLEQRYKFVVPRNQVWRIRPIIGTYFSTANAFVQRVKVIAESRGGQSSEGLRVWREI
ncbi:hypothetical protein ACT4S2_08965 [Kocuria turfanensis]|uniref:hypothetical protein n=1 Tax=Kocuria turfanensis TaxID=388357 RepID=UPI0040372E0C